MSPVVFASNQENQLSDEEYVIYRAKMSQKHDEYSAKAWMITAKTLFPRNFAVQLEAYTSLKAANNPKEAARYFSSLFFDFPNEPGLWEEVQEITEALQSGCASAASQFHRDLFSHMLLEVQHQLLLAMANRTEDTLEHSRLMLVLLSKFPQSIDIHGKKLVDTLLNAEKHGSHQSPVNCFRKLLIVDLLPILLDSNTSDIPQKTLQRLILKSIEFYVSWLSCGSSNIEGLVEPDIKPGEPWNNLFKIMVAMGLKLGWDLCSIFGIESNRKLMCQNLWAFSLETPMGSEENPRFRQLLYCTTVLLVESLYECMSKLEPACFQASNQGSKSENPGLILLIAFNLNAVKDGSESGPKRHKDEPRLTISKNCSNSVATALSTSFTTAVNCWDLLHQTEELGNEFAKLCQHLRTDTWSWFPNFVIDSLIYQGRFTEALAKLQSSCPASGNQQALLLKSAGILYSLGNHVAAVEQALHVVANLSESSKDLPCSQPVTISSSGPSGHGKPELHFMALYKSEIVQYCVSVLVACLKERAFKKANEDLAAGHLIVLLQYDWPRHSGLLVEIVDKIRRQGHFTYPLFASYIIQVNILEEFLYLGTDQGNYQYEGVDVVNMDIFPTSSTQMATQRRMTTRCVDKGAKEDFRSSMKRQLERHSESVQNTVVRFMVQEREMILQALQTY